VLLQAFDDFLVERREFADLLLQNFLHVIFAEFAQVIEADKTFVVPAGLTFFDELKKRRPNQFRNHSAVRRFRFFANLADKCGGSGFAHRISLLN
jgi:hypothetical protein